MTENNFDGENYKPHNILNMLSWYFSLHFFRMPFVNEANGERWLVIGYSFNPVYERKSMSHINFNEFIFMHDNSKNIHLFIFHFINIMPSKAAKPTDTINVCDRAKVPSYEWNMIVIFLTCQYNNRHFWKWFIFNNK